MKYIATTTYVNEIEFETDLDPKSQEFRGLVLKLDNNVKLTDLEWIDTTVTDDEDIEVLDLS